jgi:hypothetical protein
MASRDETIHFPLLPQKAKSGALVGELLSKEEAEFLQTEAARAATNSGKLDAFDESMDAKIGQAFGVPPGLIFRSYRGGPGSRTASGSYVTNLEFGGKK